MEQPLTEVELAYIAGLFDGEGWLCLTFHKYKTSAGEGSYRLPVPSFGIANKNREVLDWIRQRIGYGALNGHENKYGEVVKLTFNGSKRANDFLPKMMPFLRIKKREAEIVLEAARYIIERKGRYWTDEEFVSFAGKYRGTLDKVHRQRSMSGTWRWNEELGHRKLGPRFAVVRLQNGQYSRGPAIMNRGGPRV
jgi:hypothetical protein